MITQTYEQTSEALSPCEWIYSQSRAQTSSPVTAPVHKADHKWALDALGLRRKGQGEIASVCPNARGNLGTNKTYSGNGPFPGQPAEQPQSTGRRGANSMSDPKSEQALAPSLSSYQKAGWAGWGLGSTKFQAPWRTEDSGAVQGSDARGTGWERASRLQQGGSLIADILLLLPALHPVGFLWASGWGVCR